MVRNMLVVLAVVLALGGWSAVGATTWYVDQNNVNATDSGPGTQTTPYKTINKGTSVAVAGDTVLVNAGRYYEWVGFAHGGTSGNPITLKAATGQRVIVDGALLLTSWTQCDSSYSSRNSNYANIYHKDITTASGYRPFALYQDDVGLSEAVWPAIGWYLPTSAVSASTSAGSSSLTDSVHLTQANGYWTGGRIIYFAADINYLSDTTITSYTQSTHTLTIAGQWTANDTYTYNRYQIYDKLESITGPGQWAFDSLGGGSYRVYVWTAGGSPNSHVMAVPNANRFGIELGAQTNITIDGLEVCHSAGGGVGGWPGLTTPANYTIQNCTIHDNYGSGLYLTGMPNSLAYHNYIGYNGGGVMYNGANTVVRENEICYNGNQGGSSCDGIDVTGPGGASYSTGQVVDHNYVHDHVYWYSHCDSIQSWANVSGILVENNVFLNSCQSYMMNDMDSTTLSNNIFAQSAASMIHNYVTNTTVIHNTMANAGYGNLSNAYGSGFNFHNNLFYLGHGGWNYGGVISAATSYVSDYNLFYPCDGASEADSPVVWTNSDSTIEWDWTWAQYKSGSGQDGHSVYATGSAGNPAFVNAPAFFSQCGEVLQVFFTPSKVYLNNNDLSFFAVGDHIEIDHDGVVRTVSGTGSNTTLIPGTTLYYVTFSPSDAKIATNAYVVANWKTNTNYLVNYNLQSSSPAKGQASDGGNLGSSISMSQMVAGDFNGDGTRDIPSWPLLYTVTVNQTAHGTVSVSPSLVKYGSGATPTVTATASSGYTFVSWTVTGGTISPSKSSATLTVQGNVTLSASFTVSFTGTE